MPKLLKSDAITVQRPPDEKVQTMRSIFLNFDTKMKSPDFIIPSDDIQQKEELFNELKTTVLEIKNVAESTELTKAYPDFPLPGMGELTGLEWINFVIYHVQRHNHQLSNIYEKLT